MEVSGIVLIRSYLKSKFVCITQQGFTILEVLIAIVVATIGLLSLCSMQVSAIRGNGLAGKSTQAIFLAQGMLERIKDGNMLAEGTFGFMDMTTAEPGTIQDSGLLTGIDEKGDIGGPFDLQWQVATNTDWSRRITVDVSWKSILGRKRNVSLTSIARGDGS